MIKANELRIGNWISDVQANNGKWQVRELGISECIYGRHYQSNYENLRPVPLTPEILEAAGFTKGHNTGYWQFYSLSNHWHIGEWFADKPVAGFEQKGKFYYGDDFLEVKSLHQLQNLFFALTGEELEIKFP